ncbi:MAG: ribosomal protein S18-alanine N-acetyltransferase [Clostridia bacterium]|nr:ribosomal protein S18-alanine N-acetyltransferase [Clostridia bacterium]
MNEETKCCRIKELTVYELEEICLIEQECFESPWEKQDFQQMISDPDRLYLVAIFDKMVAGGCAVRHIMGDGEITNVAVKNAFRKRGIASALIDELLIRGARMGIEAFTLEVRAGNQQAIHLYEKKGFVTEGIRKNFYRNPTEDALIMWKR